MAISSGKWNSFQRTMWQWNTLHPYNAVHVMTFSGSPDPARLQATVATVLEKRGLTGLVMEPARGRFRYTGGPWRGVVRSLVDEGGGDRNLITEIEQQLNAPFSGSQAEPFRFVVFAGRNAFRLLLAYFHPVADAECVVRLMQDIYSGYHGRDPVGGLEPWQTQARPRDLVMLGRPFLLLRWLMSLPSSVRSARASHRPDYRDPGDQRNGFRFFVAEEGVLNRVIGAARAWGTTVNDLFLAALLMAVSPLATGRRQASRRRLLAVASIVNVRRELGIEAGNTFGLALGSLRVAHEVPEGSSLADVARSVREQTGRAKRGKFYLATPLQLMLARAVFSRYSPDRQRRFYQKNQPLWGGVTNLNLNPLWQSTSGEGPPDYWRAVSTGPATPLVFSLTTAGERLNVGISYRTTVFLNSDVERVQDDFHNLLAHLDPRP